MPGKIKPARFHWPQISRGRPRLRGRGQRPRLPLRGAPQQIRRVAAAQQRLLHFEPALVALAVARQQRCQRGGQLAGQGGTGAAVHQQRFRRDAFGVDDLVMVEQHLVILDESAIDAADAAAIDQMPRPHQQFGPARAQPVLALIDEQPVIGAHQQVARGVERACPDQHRRKISGGALGALADPADRLRAVIAGQDHVAHAQRLHRALRAGGQRDGGAAAEGGAGGLRKTPQRLLGRDAHQRVILSRHQRPQFEKTSSLTSSMTCWMSSGSASNLR